MILNNVLNMLAANDSWTEGRTGRAGGGGILYNKPTVSELMGWVRNVVLIKCLFGSGKPRGVGISGRRVYEPGEGMGKLVYEQLGNEVDGS